MRDFTNRMHVAKAFEPKAAVTADTAQVSTAVDLAGSDGCTLVLITGTNADLDATFTLTMAESDASNMTPSNAVAAADLVGTVAGGSFGFADDYEVRKIGYKGTKRYVQATITPANNTGNLFLAGVWVLNGQRYGPQAFPS